MSGVHYITTPSGVRIGSAYQRPLPRMDRDAERLQRALLDPRTRPLPPLWVMFVAAMEGAR
jgi:hypothetical protein